MIAKDYLNQMIRLLVSNKNLIITGAPGTGKTYLAQEIAKEMGCSKDEIGFVQFHPSYDYTDFVEGLRPIKDTDGKIVSKLKDGVFKEFCKRAAKNLEDSKKTLREQCNEVINQTKSAPKVDRKNYVFIVDEINRGDVSKIFGELFYAIDPGYRGETDIRVKTQYQNLVPDTDVFAEGFYIPENVYILATLNNIVCRTESLDFALCRRFAFVEVTAEDSLKMIHSKEMLDKSYSEIELRMNNLNRCISTIQGLSPAYQIGAACFLKLEKYLENETITDYSWHCLWNHHLKGLLYACLRGIPDAEEILNEQLYNAYSLKDIYNEEDGKVVKMEDDDDE